MIKKTKFAYNSIIRNNQYVSEYRYETKGDNPKIIT
jgi:hypothetical protein